MSGGVPATIGLGWTRPALAKRSHMMRLVEDGVLESLCGTWRASASTELSPVAPSTVCRPCSRAIDRAVAESVTLPHRS